MTETTIAKQERLIEELTARLIRCGMDEFSRMKEILSAEQTKLVQMKAEQAKYLDDLRTMPPYKMVNELESMRKPELTEIAIALNLPLRYDRERTLKSKDVLAAAIYQAIMQQANA